MEGLKGFGIASPEGPISLDELIDDIYRSCYLELRKQLENHVVTIDTLHDENRLAVECHENEKKVLKESVARAYLDELNFNERLNGTKLSCSEANEIANRVNTSFNLAVLVTRRRINFTVDNSEPSPTGQRIGFSVSSCSLVSEKYGKLASSI
ncbi:unnamed protein product [Prunus armeniaca]|uniref:Uncharacterized protein n=1 Tax=Prunus armeniaca TaxID=36596 RepID=A0A6J5U0Q7_PRUAR|nr:unnamed protein product [Prunus armeniaca]